MNQATDTQSTVPSAGEPFRILSLDGGGAKGFYTLGVLTEIEALIKKPLCEHFHLIFGTSTGAIIGALLALGHRVGYVYELYKTHVPAVMRIKNPHDKSKALSRLCKSVFKELAFSDAKTLVGIVATRWILERPMIFKSDPEQAHGRISSFVPGFGFSIAEAVAASCSAYPFFDKVTLVTPTGVETELIDGGYCANNPTLYAIAEALKALKKRPEDLRVISVGVGQYPEPTHWGPKRWKSWAQKRLVSIQLLQKTLNVNTASMEQLRSILFDEIRTVRINDTFERPEMATDMMESDIRKLNILYQSGSESFAKQEKSIKELLGVTATSETRCRYRNRNLKHGPTRGR
jgi:predicted acylesterase/phospholipase RssA